MRSVTRERLAAPLESARGPQRWLALFVVARGFATLVAVLLLSVHRVTDHDPVLIVITWAWGILTVTAALEVPAVRGSVVCWLADGAVALALTADAGDWRSPFYLLMVTALVLPATQRSPLFGNLWGVGLTGMYLLVAILEGIDLAVLRTTARIDTLATHLLVPLLVTFALTYASAVLRRLERVRRRSERLAVEAERRRIAFELHDSAKQRIHAAHLVLSAVAPSIGAPQDAAVAQALDELNRATADMDTSVAELREPLEGGRLDTRLRRRVAELARATSARIEIRGRAPELPALTAAHAYRIAAEAVTNAVRHSGADLIDVAIDGGEDELLVVVSDDGVGMPDVRRPGSHGLRSMRHRAATIGAELRVGPGAAGRGTTVVLSVPLESEGDGQ